MAKDYDPGYTASYKDKKAAQRKLTAKDSAIKHVMSGVNPQGCQVVSFKTHSAEELDHDYMWRTTKALPERGRIGIFRKELHELAAMLKKEG
jgi:polyphosphate kinase 2 (PPK2 family)